MSFLDSWKVGEAVQLSVAEADKSDGLNVTDPEERLTVVPDADSEPGAVLSNTVIVAVAVSVLPAPSVTVRVTVTGVPMSVQSNAVMSRARLATEQSSEEPLSTWDAVMDTLPVAST